MSKKDLFPTHLTPADINAGIKSGKLMQGSFFLSHTNYREANVLSDAHDGPILIQGKTFQQHNSPIYDEC